MSDSPHVIGRRLMAGLFPPANFSQSRTFEGERIRYDRERQRGCVLTVSPVCLFQVAVMNARQQM